MLGRTTALIMALFMMFSGSAAAQDGRWLRAESDHFIVYGRMNESQLRQAAQRLEDFDWVLRAFTRSTAPAAETKLEVYLVRDDDELRRVSPRVGSALGFYQAGAEQIAAFVIYRDSGSLSRETVLFHEYAHHFMLHYFPHAYPRWFIEGWAEYVGATEIQGRRASVGVPSEARGRDIEYRGILPGPALLAPERVRNPDAEFWAGFYANAWFAVSYLYNNDLQSALMQYVEQLGEGGDAIEAFEPSFGFPADEFQRRLINFRRNRIDVFNYNLPPPTTNITVTRLPRSADDLLLPLARLRMTAGQTDDDAQEFAGEIEALAAGHAGDQLAALASVRTALVREDFASARERADAILAADETHTEARYLRAYAMLQQATQEEALSFDHIRDARRELARGFRSDPNHFPTLFLYAGTFANGHTPMTNEQLDVLARSLELAPQADHIRLTLARELMVAAEFDTAVRVLRPLLYAPHGGQLAAQARVYFDAARNRQPPPIFLETLEEVSDDTVKTD